MQLEVEKVEYGKKNPKTCAIPKTLHLSSEVKENLQDPRKGHSDFLPQIKMFYLSGDIYRNVYRNVLHWVTVLTTLGQEQKEKKKKVSAHSYVCA